jgi:hypothetical protein
VTDRPRAAVVLTLVALTLCACRGARDEPDQGRPVPLAPGPTLPATPEPTLEVRQPPPPVAWADDGRRLAVTTTGSSSCPVGPTDIKVVGEQEVRVELAFLSADRGACTADLASTTTEIEVPRGISADEPLTVVLHREGGEEQFVVPASGN